MKLRVALAQINPTVGDLLGNSSLVRSNCSLALAQGAHVIVFPEMILTGYPVEDLATRPSFQQASRAAISELATTIARDGNSDLVAVVGYLDATPQGPQNAVAVIHGGEVTARYVKRHLPNYGVFDEYRNFISGISSLVVRIHGVDVGIAICEDIWIDGDVLQDLVSRRPGLVVVPNGSPFERNKDDVRLALVQKRALEIGAPLAYVNMTGGQDDLVFDGDTIVVDAMGEVIARTPQFEDGLVVVDLEVALMTSEPDVVISHSPVILERPISPDIAARLDDREEIWQALVIGLRDYVEKNGFKKCGAWPFRRHRLSSCRCARN